MALGGIPVSCDQIQNHHAACGQFPLLAVRCLPNFFVGVTRRWVAMAIEELGIGELGVHSAGLRGVLQVIARFGAVAFAFQLPGVGREIIGRPRSSAEKQECQQDK